MIETKSSTPTDLTTIGFTSFLYGSGSDQAFFNVRSGVPIVEALSQASDLLFLAKSFAEDAAYDKENDRHAWAAHYLTIMGKALMDDVTKSLMPRVTRTKTESEAELPESM